MANILENRVLTGVIRKLDPPQNLIGVSDIVDETIPAPSNLIEWDEISLSKELAQFSAPDAEANRVDRDGVTLREARTASIREKKNLKGKTLSWLREPGTENQQMARAGVRRAEEDLNRRIQKRVEWMIWQALHGSITYQTEDYNLNVTFNLQSSHQDDPTSLSNGQALWSDDKNATPIQDLIEMQEIVEDDSNSSPNTVFMTRKVLRNIVSNSQVQSIIGEDQLTEQLFQTGQIQSMAGLDVVIYDASYNDSSGNSQKFVGQNDVVVMDTNFSNVVDMIEAPAVDPKANFGPGMFSKSWETEDPPAINVLTEYQVLPILRKPDAVYTTNVL